MVVEKRERTIGRTRVDFRTHDEREWIISHFEPTFRPKPGDYPLSFFVVVGDVLKRLVKQERPQ